MRDEKPEKIVDIETMQADVSAPTTMLSGLIATGGALSAFGYRDFRLLWPGAVISNIGTWIHFSVLMWYVKSITGSDSWVAVVNLANFLPVLLFVLYAGSLADHLNRKKLIIVTQAVMLVAALALGITTSLGVANLAVIISITAVMGIAFVFNFPAWRSIVADLVPREDLLNGIAIDAAGFNAARCIGPALGALVVSVWSVAGAFYVNAISFTAVIIALFMIRTKTPSYPPPEQGTRKHIMEGVAYVRSHRIVRNMLLILLVASFFGIPYIVLLPGVSHDVFGRGVVYYGILLGATGLGAVAAAPLVTVLNRRMGERDIIRVSAAAVGLLLVAFSLSRVIWLSPLISVGLGASYLMLSASINTVLQGGVEREMRGRIMSFYILVFQGVFPIGGLVMGYLAVLRSAPFALFVGGSVVTLLAAVLIAFPSILRGARPVGEVA